MTTKLQVQRPLHHGSLAARAPVVPLPASRGRMVRAIPLSQRDPRRSSVSGELRIERISLPIHRSPLAFFFPHRKRGGRTPTDADPTTALAHGTRSAERARLSAFHRGSHLREYSSQRLSFRPGFLGRGLRGRYPASPVPVQGCTSHPGHNAGRHDAQAARERTANPPAGTAPAPPHGLPPVGVPW
jgi:hypothetical protein